MSELFVAAFMQPDFYSIALLSKSNENTTLGTFCATHRLARALMLIILSDLGFSPSCFQNYHPYLRMFLSLTLHVQEFLSGSKLYHWLVYRGNERLQQPSMTTGHINILWWNILIVIDEKLLFVRKFENL